MNVALWIIQVLLALLFLFAGGVKMGPIEEMVKLTGLSATLIRFIGVVEILGGLGLILPGLFRIKPMLTPLAAVGLLIIMIGATVMALKSGPVNQAMVPLVTGLLLAFVAYGRGVAAPHHGR